ncbi:mitotic spindle checkpoint protein Bub3 [Saitoella coloradoensis]
MSKAESQFELVPAPTDGVTSLDFSPTVSSNLIVSSWDKTVRLFDVTTEHAGALTPRKGTLLATLEHQAPVLDACWGDGMHVFTAGLDGRVKVADLNTSNNNTLGLHDDGVSSIAYNTETSLLISGSWDKSLRLWDHRSKHIEAGLHVQPHKIFSIDMVGNKLVVAMAKRQIYIFDVRNMQQTLQKRESSLKFMTKTVKCMPNGEGYASSSIEGRVAVEYFDPSPESQTRSFAFKCHRQAVDGVDTIYPVNALAFHPVHGTFASGGGDGTVALWDGGAKKRLKQYPRYPTGVSALAFSHDGKYLAIGTGSGIEDGKEPVPGMDKVYLRHLQPEEGKPKALAA